MKTKTTFSNRRRILPPPKRKALLNLLNRAIELARLDLKENESVAFFQVGPRTIAKLNSDFVGHKGVTDVISFDYRTIEEPEFDLEPNVGIEIFVCVDVALKEGNSRKNSSYSEEMVLYFVHGLLHAAGEDDLSPQKRRKMRQREREVIKQLGMEFDLEKIFPSR